MFLQKALFTDGLTRDSIFGRAYCPGICNCDVRNIHVTGSFNVKLILFRLCRCIKKFKRKFPRNFKKQVQQEKRIPTFLQKYIIFVSKNMIFNGDEELSSIFSHNSLFSQPLYKFFPRVFARNIRIRLARIIQFRPPVLYQLWARPQRENTKRRSEISLALLTIAIIVPSENAEELALHTAAKHRCTYIPPCSLAREDIRANEIKSLNAFLRSVR